MFVPSLGVRQRDRESWRSLVLVELSLFPASIITCCAFLPSILIFAAIGANSGDRAKFLRCSTESRSGTAASRHDSRFSMVTFVAKTLIHLTSCAVALATSLAH